MHGRGKRWGGAGWGAVQRSRHRNLVANRAVDGLRMSHQEQVTGPHEGTCLGQGVREVGGMGSARDGQPGTIQADGLVAAGQ